MEEKNDKPHTVILACGNGKSRLFFNQIATGAIYAQGGISGAGYQPTNSYNCTPPNCNSSVTKNINEIIIDFRNSETAQEIFKHIEKELIKDYNKPKNKK